MSLLSQPQIIRLTPDDEPKVTHVLAEAFRGYPVMRFVLGISTDYDARLHRLVHLFVMARVLRGDPVIGIGDESDLWAATTMSFPDGSPSPSAFEVLKENIWRELGPETRARYDLCVTAWEPLAPAAPQLHVNMIGVRPVFQGMGLSRRLLDYIHELSRTSPKSTGVSLTTEHPPNVALYQHFGYQIVGHARVAPQLETWGFFRPNGAS